MDTAVAVADPELELKCRFAAAWLRNPSEAFLAAREIFGADTGQALKVATEWVTDPIVLAERDRLFEVNGPAAYLPTKHDLAREVWEASRTTKGNHDARIKYLKLYAEIMTFIERPAVNNGVINNNINRVMEITSHGSDDEWEAASIKQQQNLLKRGLADVIDVVPMPSH